MKEILLCHNCGNRTLVSILSKGIEVEELEFDNGIFEIEHHFWFIQCDNCGKHSLYYCLDDNPHESKSLWPVEKQISSSVPEPIVRAYQDAQKVKRISRIGFVILIRRSLEILCKQQGANGKDLYTKLKDLGIKKVVPEKLAEMADLIRALGNEGAHEDQFGYSDTDIDILDNFYLALIEYIYLAPEKVKQLREKLKK